MLDWDGDISILASAHAERAHAAALKAVPELVDACVDYLNQPVTEIYNNQREIEQEQQAVKAEIQRLVSNTQRLSILVRSVSEGLKEVSLSFQNSTVVVGIHTHCLLGQCGQLALAQC